VEEFAAEAKRAYDAGAAVVHIHARNDDGSPTFSPRLREDQATRCARVCPIILNFSTGTILDDVSEQARTSARGTPEIAALNMGTMNYSKYSAKRKASTSTWSSRTPTRRSSSCLRP
jgi:3-keto-5-aminohexanoate cleavage enzyme